jgi:hypothetical protein
VGQLSEAMLKGMRGTHVTCTRVGVDLDHVYWIVLGALVSGHALSPNLSHSLVKSFIVHVRDHDRVWIVGVDVHIVRDEPLALDRARWRATHGEELDLAVSTAAHRDLRGVEVGEVQEATRLAHVCKDAHKLASVRDLEYLRGEQR